MKKFLADKALIPSDSLVEVKFEDLEEDPLGQLQRVYDGLGLPGFERAAPAVRAYVCSIEGYQKNRYEIDDDVIKSVNRHWRFALDECTPHARHRSLSESALAVPSYQYPANHLVLLPTETCTPCRQ